MRLLILLFFLALSIRPVLAEFHDPMRPPAYALEKYRLAKIKKTAVTRKVQKKVVAKHRWVLNSILFSPGRQHAIINNKLVNRGGKVDGAKLIELQSGSVTLLSKGKKIKLTINESQVRLKSIKKSLAEKKI